MRKAIWLVAGTVAGVAVLSRARMTLHTGIEIDAPPERVWAILTDFARYPEWNPFVSHVEGEARAGDRLRVTLRGPGEREMEITPILLAVEPERELRWRGQAGASLLFTGEHSFTLAPLGQGRTHFVQREEFSGAMVPFLARMLDKDTRAGFEAMNRALKARAESGT